MKENVDIKQRKDKCFFDCNENGAKQLVRTWGPLRWEKSGVLDFFNVDADVVVKRRMGIHTVWWIHLIVWSVIYCQRATHVITIYLSVTSNYLLQHHVVSYLFPLSFCYVSFALSFHLLRSAINIAPLPSIYILVIWHSLFHLFLSL